MNPYAQIAGLGHSNPYRRLTGIGAMPAFEGPDYQNPVQGHLETTVPQLVSSEIEPYPITVEGSKQVIKDARALQGFFRTLDNAFDRIGGGFKGQKQEVNNAQASAAVTQLDGVVQAYTVFARRVHATMQSVFKATKSLRQITLKAIQIGNEATEAAEQARRTSPENAQRFIETARQAVRDAESATKAFESYLDFWSKALRAADAIHVDAENAVDSARLMAERANSANLTSLLKTALAGWRDAVDAHENNQSTLDAMLDAFKKMSLIAAEAAKTGMWALGLLGALMLFGTVRKKLT